MNKPSPALNLFLRTDIRANPFELKFDRELVIKEIQKEGLGNSPILYFLLYCESINNDIQKEVAKSFENNRISKDLFFDCLFQEVNSAYLKLIGYTKRALDKSASFDIEAMSFIKLEKDGKKLDLSFLVEIGPDITAIIINWISTPIAIKAPFKNDDTINKNETSAIIQRLWIYANIFLNIKNSAYAIFLYENGNVTLNEKGDFKIESDFKNLALSKSCGELRTRNHVNEANTFLQKSIIQTKSPFQLKCIANNDVLHFELHSRVETNNIQIGISQLLTYHFYSMNIELDYFGGLTLRDLAQLLYLIDEAVSTFMYESTLETAPLKIEKKNLSEIIGKLTDKDNDTISKIMDSLCSDTISPYFWRGGLYSDGNYLYCPLISITAPNYNLYYDKWLALAMISDEQKENLFTQCISKEILNKEIDYELSVVGFEEVGLKEDFFSNNIILKTKNNYLLLQVILYEFPIEYDEVYNSLKSITKVAFDLKNKMKLVEGILQKEIIPLLITNYTHFSGMDFDGIPIADYTLFNNYFSSGRYNRTKVIYHKDKFEPIKASEFRYYRDEDEFSENIKHFFEKPAPVYKILEKLFLQEITITPPFLHKQILIDKVEYLPEEIIVQDDIEYLSNLLKTEYFGKTPDEKSRLSDTINFQLQSIFTKVGHGSKSLMKLRTDIYDAVSGVHEIGFFHLSIYMVNTLPELRISINKGAAIPFKELDYEQLDRILERLMQIMPKQRRISDFNIGNDFSTEEKEQLLSFAEIAIADLSIKTYSNAEYDNYIMALTILSAIRNDFEIDKVLFSGFSNLVDSLNYNNRTQDARDVCEEILIVYSLDNKHWNAWCILFKCYSYQKNHFDAAMYGCLLFTDLTSLPEIPYHILVVALQNVLIFFRNFHYYEFAKNIYNSAMTFPLDEYDNQRIAASYFNMLLLTPSLFKETAFEEIYLYLEEKIGIIITFGNHGIVPWLAIVYNLIRLKNEYGFEINEVVYEHIKTFEKNLTQEEIQHLQTTILGKPENLKTTFISALKNIYQTRNVSDFSSEINNIAVLAENLLKASILENNLDGILLSGQVLNDQTFTFENRYIENDTLREFNTELSIDKSERWEQYGKNIIDTLMLKEGQLLLWVFELYRKVYLFSVDSTKKWQAKELKSWDLQSMKLWIDNLGHFYFNSKKLADYDIVEQEKEYEKTLAELKFSELSIENKFSEILLVNSIGMSEFPHNLYVQKGNFIGTQYPVCNILSLERHCIKANDIALNEIFTSSAWIPIDDAEGTISWGYEKLQSLLLKYKTTEYKTRYPSEKISTDINIFLAHGEVGSFGFKAIHTNKEIGGTLIYPSEVFGTGIIAILFICNTGKVSDHLYSNNIVSFATELLKNNYEAVIAPFWKLDVTISGIWLDEFLKTFKGGYSINEAVYFANKEIAKYQESVSGSYYAVEGQLAMHLYGNPNIKIK